MSGQLAKILSLALAAGDARPTILLNHIAGTGRTVSASVRTERFGYWLLDTTETTDGRLVVIEANGTNGATSSIGNADHDRVCHMLAALLHRGQAGPGRVAVLLHQDGFHHVPEFYARALAFFETLNASGIPCSLLAPGDTPNASDFNIVIGDIPTVAKFLERDEEGLNYLGAPMVFATNPNLLPALARAGVRTNELDTSFFHEGPLAWLAHDKAAQQDLCEDTPFTRLWNRESTSKARAVADALMLHSMDKAAVVKTNGTSGGTGVRIIPIGADPERVVDDLVAETVSRYGPGTEKTLFPLRTFEFAQAAPLPRADGQHLWDLRLELTAIPGRVTARPVMVRICPAPFSPDLPHDAVVSNLSHRAASTSNILDPSVLDTLRQGMVDDLVEAGLAWASNAAAWSASAVAETTLAETDLAAAVMPNMKAALAPRADREIEGKV